MNGEIETVTKSFELPIILSCPKDKPCMTKNGMVCHFPFTFKGNIYDECITNNAKLCKFPGCMPKLGCFPSVDDGESHWESCTSGCSGLRGKYLHKILGIHNGYRSENKLYLLLSCFAPHIMTLPFVKNKSPQFAITGLMLNIQTYNDIYNAYCFD